MMVLCLLVNDSLCDLGILRVGFCSAVDLSYVYCSGNLLQN